MNNPQANGFSSFDREGLEEYREVLTDLAPKIERDIALLRKHGEGSELIDSLFRAIHNLKGDASLFARSDGIEIAWRLLDPVLSG